MLREIEESVILKQEYSPGNGKYYILIKTDTSAIAFYGSYGNRESMRIKVMPKSDYFKKKLDKEKSYNNDYGAKYDKYIPRKHMDTFILTIKDNSNMSVIINKELEEKEKAEKEKLRVEKEKLEKEKLLKKELELKKKANMEKVKDFGFSL